MAERITALGKMPLAHKGVKAENRTPEQERDSAANKYAYNHRWTAEEVAALPEAVRPHIEPIFQRQQARKKGD